MKSGEKYEEIELVKKDKNDEKLSDGDDSEMELVKKDETDEKPSDGEDSEMEMVKKDDDEEKPSDGEDPDVVELMRKSKHDAEESDGDQDDEMDLVEKDEKAYDDGEDPEDMEMVKKVDDDEKPSDGEDPAVGELMRKSEHGVKQTDGDQDDEELATLRKQVDDLESRVEAAKSALELIKVAKEGSIAPTILPIKASIGDESVSYLKNKESSLRDEYTRLIAALKREVADYIASQELSKAAEDLHKKARENVNLSCQLTAQVLRQKELNKHCDDLKKEKEDILQIIKKNKEDLRNLGEAKEKLKMEKACLLEQLAGQDLKDKNIKDLHKLCDDLKKEKEKIIKEDIKDLHKLCDDLKKEKEKIIKENIKDLNKLWDDLKEKEKIIKENKEALRDLGEAKEKHKTENAELLAQLVAKDKILKEHEETLPKIIQGSPLQRVHDSIPACMRACLAPNGSISGDELGTFMGSLVTTTAYNVTYSNSDLKEFLFWNSFANLIGSMFGQICNNVVTQMSQTDMKKEGATKAFKIIWKSIFWILLGGLVPIFAGGFIKKYCVRLIVTAASAFVMKCGATTLWKKSYEIPTWQPVLIVLLAIFGIGIAAGIPHLVKVASGKK